MRSFVGIPLDDAMRAGLADLAARIRRDDPLLRGEKWVAEQNLHITVAFLGDLDEEQAAALGGLLDEGLAGLPEFSLPLGGIGAVPSARRARMVWASFADPDGRAAQVYGHVCDACDEVGIELESRPFRPHVTLARLRRPHSLGQETNERLDRLGSDLPGFVSVSRVTLFSSTLGKAGPRYESLRTWDLGA